MLEFRFKQTPKMFTAFWNRVATPKRKTIIWSANYLVLASVGLYSLFVQPDSVLVYTAGPAVLYALCTLLVLGGVIGLPSALFGETKLERIASSALILASGLYCVFLLIYHFESPSNRILHAGFVLVFFLLAIERFLYLLQRPIAPRNETVLGHNS